MKETSFRDDQGLKKKKTIFCIGICSWDSENAKSRIGMDLVVMQIELYEGERSIYNVMVAMQMGSGPTD